MLLLGVFFSCEEATKEIIPQEVEKNQPDQIGKDVEILYSTNGRVSFQLNAPLMNQYHGEKPYTEMPEGVHIQTFDSLMNVKSELTADYAIDLKYEDKMEAKGNVVVINEKGEKLNTEHLVWDKKTKQITSDVFVKITTDNEVLSGDGLISNQDFTEYRILKPRGVINLDE